MAQLSIGQSMAANLMLGTTQVQRVFLGTLQIWADEVVVVLGNASSIVLSSYFTAEQWSNPYLKKRVVIPVGVEIGATTASYAVATSSWATGQAGAWRGQLTLEVRGTISGLGGAPNSGAGGDVITLPFLGRDGQKLIVNNHGTLRPGGAGGGRGGNGGGGTYEVVQQDRYAQASSKVFGSAGDYFWLTYPSGGVRNFIFANGPEIWRTGTVDITRVTVGGQIYERGSYVRNEGNYALYRLKFIGNAASSGGQAGTPGRGQGYDGSATAGAAPVAGGQNAGASGKSGDGGAWGQPGAAGAAGSNGNASNGLAGTAGGLAGCYLNGAANAQFNNFGTVLGRVQ